MGRKRWRRQEEPSTRGIAWPRWTGFRGMTVRDWLPIIGALLIPIAVAAGTGWITWQQGEIADQSAEAGRQLAAQRAQDEALQAYLDQMTQLILDRKLLEAKEGDPVYTLAQARTSTIIASLDAEHNRSVTRFLTDSGLMGAEESSVNLLKGIDLARADLSNAYLFEADLRDATLTKSTLRNANLIGANLNGVKLFKADLRDAQLSFAEISHVALLSGANLSGADLHGVDLSGAFLRFTDLSDTSLGEADLRDAGLGYADLSNADLSGADLEDAEGITEVELEQQAASLKGTTMPNGQKYEN